MTKMEVWCPTCQRTLTHNLVELENNTAQWWCTRCGTLNPDTVLGKEDVEALKKKVEETWSEKLDRYSQQDLERLERR